MRTRRLDTLVAALYARVRVRVRIDDRSKAPPELLPVRPGIGIAPRLGDAKLPPAPLLVAQALARARLYDAEHDRARQLQQGPLLRALPPTPALTAAARYLPATEGTEVGGDCPRGPCRCAWCAAGP
ncbi:hypothetical protein ACIBSV_30120 [Embleya sp. NPDC050154]|uniref:hypothetical protein n=1 Tax=unclassified Embleya TaxID=2699296 RepID=UPI00379AA5E2